MSTLEQAEEQAEPADAPSTAARAAAAAARWARLRVVGSVLAVAVVSFWLGARVSPLVLAGSGDGLRQGTWLPTPAPPMAYVGGAVRHPGLYALAPDARVAGLLRQAGGLTRSADLAHLNLAAPVHDGEMLTIPSHRRQACNR